MKIDKYSLLELPKLSRKEFIERSKKLSKRYRVGDGKNFRLNDYNTDESPDFDKEDKPLVKEILQSGVKTLTAMQDVLYANDKWALLLIFQGMDASGKDGAIKHVMSGINPQGCQVTSFKAPSAEDLDHDYMWRCMTHLPERGRIGIFNRSYYEEVLIVRVHEQILRSQSIPEKLITNDIWQERF